MRINMQTVSVAILLAAALSCSNAKRDFGQIQRLQETNVQLLAQDTPYETRLQACKEVISSLNEFLARHRGGKWHDAALFSLSEWQNREELVRQERAYTQLQAILESADRTVSMSNDYELKISSCDSAINAATDFLRSHDDGKLAATLEASVFAWQQRKTAYQHELDLLRDEFNALSKERAVSLAEAQHTYSHIDKITLKSSTNQKNGAKVFISDIYDVRMKDGDTGRKFPIFKVHVNGYIDYDSRDVVINEDARVEK